ncbi:acylamidase [Variibacter gotjawalensis]|uniref:Indoleacetamide hydrolase n=1 Tax=Variibacter gotjawalensis TaxID=1333996 RepID=A0A0S3PPE4_9BRAD|nr:amidase family protein [Variibacter gotjawalensis]NIK47939.1 amidase [Variibacter gotjawalensis]RZS49817.1 amidase [Variibacter gotjawalensis]BAT57646.1 acylamidase [Variibacter gotjawalensis]
MSQLYQLDAVALAALIKNKKVSAREATDDALARMAAVNPKINSVVDGMENEARAVAAALDEKQARGEAIGPLHGVPVTVKVNVDTKGHANTNGVAAFKDNIAPDDSAVVANLRRAGAVIIGRTNTPELSSRWFTDNTLHGRTLNPWDPKITPGGSSGGASAAVATGIGTIGHGNDIGGSIRYPAYACGLAGIRPSFARVPAFNPSAKVERPVMPHQTSVQGPIARSIRDLYVGLDAMAMRDPRDPWQVPVTPVSQAPKQGPVRVALFDTWHGCKADPAVTRSLKQAASWLADAGYQVEPAAPPHYDETVELWANLLETQAHFDGAGQYLDAEGSALRNFAAASSGLAKILSPQEFIHALAQRTTLLRAWTQFFETYPILLMPSSWKLPFPIDTDQQGRDAVIAMLAAQTPQTSLPILGLPGLAVPILTEGEAPCGVQLATARYGEAMALEAGAIIEASAPKIKVIDPRN